MVALPQPQEFIITTLPNNLRRINNTNYGNEQYTNDSNGQYTNDGKETLSTC